ncbi:hypothetical protein [Piscinibacter sakaiensis]|uniref:Uncharacterized protein n=1 Tax=Piscinibacter sakaiensis TaxID=1547922 RepID=A0A0K8NT40_PISS1|nr:hypothetical protein [Piscinibacter sakaiensis]GAP33566.1 hypothetical protein ISF6_0012 [Piscinibacter sakaiensis]
MRAAALAAALLLGAAPMAGAGSLPSAATAASAAPGAAPSPVAEIAAPTPDGEDALRYIAFVEEPTAGCVARMGRQVQVRSTHPTRTLRVWLDRVHMGVGTGDRSRSDLAPGAAPEPLGCSRTSSGDQSWRIVRAVFLP